MQNLLQQAKKIACEFAQEIPEMDLILVYGEIAQGRVHELSDLYMIAICDDKKLVGNSFLMIDQLVFGRCLGRKLKKLLKEHLILGV